MNKDELQEIKDYYNTGIWEDSVLERLRHAVVDVGRLVFAVEELQAENEQLRADKRRETYGCPPLTAATAA